MIASVCGGWPMWYQGCTWLTIHGSHVVAARRSGTTTKPTAAWIAPSTVRAPSETTSTTQTRLWNGHEVGVVVDRALVHREQAAAEPAIPADSANTDDPRARAR